MDRNIVYPGAIPLDTDLLSLNRNTMAALGHIMRATLGTGVTIDGLSCNPTLPTSMSIQVGPGSMTQLLATDASPFGSLPANTSDSIIKMGINAANQLFGFQAPAVPGTAANHLIQASLQEADQGLTVLPYYNASNPAQPYSGPANSGLPQATVRSQYVQLQLKSGVPAAIGTQITPTADNGWTGLYSITTTYGQVAITNANISPLPSAPFIYWKLPNLRPGFASGVQSFPTSDTFIVPPGVFQLEAEVWGGGSGSFASVSGSPSGGGSGGGYSKKRIAGVFPGQAINVIIGSGGTGGRVNGTPATSGGATSFGPFLSATGGGLNYISSVASPQYGSTPPGIGINGDLNIGGSAGQAGTLNQGGMGGGAPMGGSQNSGTTGVPGTSPGGGASGAGTGANGNTPFDGAGGGAGLAIVRW